ncbi:MAG: hypothetical protein RJA76_2097 [Bacteroidota bacterium]|jgi:hypothetical protein
MSFNGNEGEFITLEEGAAMTARYRNSVQPGETIAINFSKQILTEILNQDECQSLRFYFAKNDEGKTNLVVTGVDNLGNDLYQGLVADRGGICPPYCSGKNPLNS